MTFEHYCAVIENSARCHGWNGFLPSLCDLNARAQLHVHEVLPEPGSDELIARQWAGPLLDQGADIYLAFRDTEGWIVVQEIVQGHIRRSQRLYISRADHHPDQGGKPVAFGIA